MRSIKLKSHFGNQQEMVVDENTMFRPQTNKEWTPKNPHHTVLTFAQALQNDVNNEQRKHIPPDNLTKQERKALQDLEKRTDLLFVRADKGGALVIWDVKDYIIEARRQLNDQDHYQQLDIDTTETNKQIINKTIERFKGKGYLKDKVADGLISNECKTAKFYLLPKVHKKNNPGRPVINSINCPTEKISKYVDYHLQDHVTKLPSYLKDSTDLINKLSKIEHLPSNSIFVSMDVKSLYTNIPNQEGIYAVRETLTNWPKLATVITTFLGLLLTMNNFIFNGSFYLQTKGCAMGTKCAPSYANLFMGKFEKDHLYPRIKGKCITYLRYIDDILLIWTASKQELKEFIEYANTIHSTIKFEFETSEKEINFLDTTIYKTTDNKIATKLFKKPTDRSAFLHKKSAHPENQKTSIPYGQALRIKRISTNEEEFRKSISQLTESLMCRGYKEEEIKIAVDKANSISRDRLLTYKTKSRSNNIPLVLTYNKTLPSVSKSIRKHWEILNIDEKQAAIFKNTRPIVAYKRNKNLKQYIGQTTISRDKVCRSGKNYNNPQKGTCRPCNTKVGNLCCKQLKETKDFVSRATNEKFSIRHNVNCKSTHVIYLLECTRCKIQYVGKCETQLNIRINNHRKDVKSINAIPICKHFNDKTHSFNNDARFTIIEQLKNMNETKATLTERLKRREDFWIKRLRTMRPDGLNTELNF